MVRQRAGCPSRALAKRGQLRGHSILTHRPSPGSLFALATLSHKGRGDSYSPFFDPPSLANTDSTSTGASFGGRPLSASRSPEVGKVFLPFH